MYYNYEKTNLFKLCLGSGEEEVPGLGKVQITSGNRTYRVSSPTKGYVPIPGRQTTQETREQGFYISFDDDHSPGSQPRRPKPPLRTKRNSPKKVILAYYILIYIFFNLYNIDYLFKR